MHERARPIDDTTILAMARSLARRLHAAGYRGEHIARLVSEILDLVIRDVRAANEEASLAEVEVDLYTPAFLEEHTRP
jgi:hypothetical protein